MNRRDFGRVLLSSAILPAMASPGILAGQGRRWSFRAMVAESCSCPIPCPCNFGRPTERVCHGTRLIRFTEGSHEGTDLARAAFVVTFTMGQWTRLYLSDTLSPAQAGALDGLLPAAFAGFHRIAQVIERVPLTVERTATTLRFSVPESTVDIRLVPGIDGGPIRITGLPSNAYHDYVQYESVEHSHRSESARWAHSGTNGFISEMRASG